MHETCGICLQDINEGEPTTYLHMHSAHGFHAFHKDCATPWVGQGRSCPTCRQDPGTPPSDLQQDTLFYGIGAAPAGGAAAPVHGQGGGGPVRRGRGPARRACGHRACHNRLSAADSARRNVKYCGHCRRRGRGPY